MDEKTSIQNFKSIVSRPVNLPIKLRAHVNGHALELPQHAAEIVEGIVLLLFLHLKGQNSG
jgi:hypothetical protein